MYADPKRIRKHVLKVCLDDYESDLVDQIVAETGEQRQVVLRKLIRHSLQQFRQCAAIEVK